MFLYQQWNTYPLPLRVKIATQFGVSKTGPTHVVDNRIQHDGYDLAAVERALTIENLQAYTGLMSTELHELYAAMVDKLEGREMIAPEAPAQPVAADVVAEEPVAEPKKKVTKKAKKE